MKLTKETTRLLRPRIDAALAQLGTELGINLRAGNCTFAADGSYATFKLDIGVIENGRVKTKEESAYHTLKDILGLPDDGIGRAVVYAGSTFTVRGLLSSRGVEKLLAERTGGGNYKLPISVLKS